MGGAILVGLLSLGWWLTRPSSDPAPEVGSATGSGTRKTAGGDAAPDAAAPAKKSGGKTYKEGSRTEIPRHVPSAAAKSAPASPAPTDAAQTQDGPVDRREGAHGSGNEVVRRIQERMDPVKDDIAECLGAWMEQDPDLEGKVLLDFQIGPDGLQDAWVEDHENVPLGPLTCFSSAVYAADWTGVTDEPLEITWPVVFTQGEDPDR